MAKNQASITTKHENTWTGKSRGSVAGYKVFVFFIQKFGIRAAYALMHVPIPYFCLAVRNNTKALHYFYTKRLGYSWLKSSLSVYRNYYVFGQSLVDKIAIPIGKGAKYSYEFDGEEHITQMMQGGEGGILISAHVGNFELAQYFFKKRDFDTAISIVITDREHEDIREYLDQFTKRDHVNFIIVKEDMAHIFEISAAIAQNRIVCISGDRFLNKTKTLEAKLLGKNAKFPIGPFQIATRMQVPVLFVYVMREPKRHYHLYARKIKVERRDAQDLLNKFAAHLELVVEKYPLQWFNFYDFWGDID